MKATLRLSASDRDCERIPPSSGGGRADTAATIHGRRLVGISNRNRFCVAPCNRGCYGIGEMPAPNHKGRRTDGGSHGNDTDFDGACLTGPQPYTGEETRVPPVCCRFPVSAGWNLERHARRKSDGRIPRPSGRGGGQFVDALEIQECRDRSVGQSSIPPDCAYLYSCFYMMSVSWSFSPISKP
jgi:hypothetical protein